MNRIENTIDVLKGEKTLQEAAMSVAKETGEEEEKDAVGDSITDNAASAYNTGKSGKNEGRTSEDRKRDHRLQYRAE